MSATLRQSETGLSSPVFLSVFYRNPAADSTLECASWPGRHEAEPANVRRPWGRGLMRSGELIDWSETAQLNSGDGLFRLSSAVGAVDSMRIKLQKLEQ
ncbi:hypothetical protein G7939_04480 [Ralstonia solanacearum]|uniref:hypothetical protein n=1 Tax=Ralstonia pseudosolanacearum TaxID=1310165 RepID=UPI00125FB621|nr:hypothetical protein [Ralstonia pseudosolanacearum]MCK4116624.1 hypothetical protein [Ralstonia pseudosolanacearum]QIK22743.1 hypothetical protein G7939_04480 [Ralstonia solanacearum]QIK29218.1 hypothetical protein G7947_13345 [Ralstonia solanacearum]QIK34126.1 hypothetical protein G7969_13345 [Ralstonia solanacearum]